MSQYNLRFLPSLWFTLTLLLAGGWSAALQAQVTFIEPENGWWYNPDEAGYGLNIEQQGGDLLVGIFIYDEAGQPIWYNTFGDYNPTTGQYQGQLIAFNGGPCLSCAYQPPTALESSPSDITIAFESASRATVTWSGRQFTIERFFLSPGDPLLLMAGRWAVTIPRTAAINNSEGFIVTLNQLATNSDGSTLLVGQEDFTEREVLVSYNASNRQYTMLIRNPNGSGAGFVFTLAGADRSTAGYNAVDGELTPAFGLVYAPVDAEANATAEPRPGVILRLSRTSLGTGDQ